MLFTVTGIILIALSSGMLGGFSKPFLNAGTLLLLGTLFFRKSTLNLLKIREGITRYAFALFCALLIVLFPGQGTETRLLIVAALLALLANADRLYFILSLAAFVTFTAGALYRFEPYVWFAAQYIAKEITSLIGRVSGQRLLMGATASGILIWLFSLLVAALATTLGKGGRRSIRFLIFGLAITVVHMLFVMFVHPVSIWLAGLLGDIEVHPLILLFIPLMLDALLASWFMSRLDFSEALAPSGRKRWYPVAASIALLVSWSLFAGAGSDRNGQRDGKILIYGKGYLTWDKPVFGRYGLRAAGMFGELPEYLGALGYSVEQDTLLEERQVDEAKTLVFINLNKKLTNEQKNRVMGFVSRGGSVLVLGDHTGLGGMMEPLNDLLDFACVKFRFDCGHYLKKDWRDALEMYQHPIFSEVKDDQDIGISVGASLDISLPNAAPLLVGKIAFSDWGDAANSKDAFLGDRRYNQGELLSDIVLVAEASYGKGKVIVFGDTSPFQNGALMSSYRFVDNVFQYLGGPGRLWDVVALRVLLIMCLLVGTGILVWTALQLGQAVAIAWTSAFLILAGLMHSADEAIADMGVNANHRLIYVDAAHLNRFSQFGSDGTWALSYHLMRNGYLPLVVKEFSAELLQKSSAAIFIAPAKSLNQRELEIVDGYMKAGGVTVWAFGLEEKEKVENLMARYQISVDNTPLGPIPTDQTSAGVRFQKAWPIEMRAGILVDTVCSGWEYPVILSQRVGNGQLTVIGDPGFLLSETLESNHKIPGSNDLFLRLISQPAGDTNRLKDIDQFPTRVVSRTSH